MLRLFGGEYEHTIVFLGPVEYMFLVYLCAVIGAYSMSPWKTENKKQQITASMYNTGVRAVTHERSSEEAILGGSVSCKSRLGMETISVHTIECDD